MLNALELTGFKSFADKTRFEFPPGITVIVGPNGSGKSNIVDGIKWVMGEQSAKSLRGGEMSDVIFKGSASGGRKAMNMAEATIVFGNERGRLPIDTPEVHVTRRVYRSGEGEYMINGQACRLRDIKDLFSGTGVGADAYSLIEQGKVDSLLASSARERRAIFEEAAGISRFKAKKIEAQRRLERVDQNLVRLADIVDEVDGRLRSVRAQASKARRYKEYSQRLQELRTQVGLNDWRQLTDQLDVVDRQLKELSDQASAALLQADSREARGLELDVMMAEVDEACRECDTNVARNRERLASRESTIAHERGHCSDLEKEIAHHRRQVAVLSVRADDLDARMNETRERAEVATEEYDGLSAQVTDHDKEQAALAELWVELRQMSQTCRKAHFDCLRRVAEHGSQVSSLESSLAAAISKTDAARSRLEQLQQEYQLQRRRLEGLQQEDSRIGETVERHFALKCEAQEELAHKQQQLDDEQMSRAELKERLSGISHRADVIEQLEIRREGVTAGAREILDLASQEPNGPYRTVQGLVADVIHVGVDSATLIETALGEVSQFIVVEGVALIEQFCAEHPNFAGRIGFLRVDDAFPVRNGQAMLDEQSGVVGRADRFVQADSQYASMLKHLLGDTWFVNELGDACRLSKTTGRGQRFVTIAGDLIERDGTLITGARHQATALISRRSELRAIRQQILDVERLISAADGRVNKLGSEIAQCTERMSYAASEHERATKQLAAQEQRVRAADDRTRDFGQQIELAIAEVSSVANARKMLDEQLTILGDEQVQNETCLSGLERQLQKQTDQLDAIDLQRQEHDQKGMSAKIELATKKQRLEGLRSQLEALELEQHERSQHVDESKSTLTRSQERLLQSQRATLLATSEAAELYLRRERYAAERILYLNEHKKLLTERNDVVEEARAHRSRARRFEDKQHKRELESGEIRHQRAALVERLREDYGVELAQLEHEPSEEEARQREAVEQEISSLRRKINNIGAVNMGALAELTDLETRHGTLAGQYEDLVSAKQSLDNIITRINADSRRLFTETLEAIRSNFQVLFRRIFGGGQADIQLEEGVDILESGIDIIATPPGKQSLNISLLSGGEKALTAVTLLLAIFQYRPSPFCVLDEVDGPLDEANIGRFIDALGDFLEWTKFVIVTHSKKTMTAATTLYGVTMQESGVSKQVSVQFDDVSADGHIRPRVDSEKSSDQADSPSSDGDERGVA